MCRALLCIGVPLDKAGSGSGVDFADKLAKIGFLPVQCGSRDDVQLLPT
jgi:hypothetical protein